MMSVFKDVAYWTLNAGGVFALPRMLLPRWPRILMYHQFSAPGEPRADGTPADLFRQQLTHITRHYRPVRLQDLAQALAAGEPAPPRSVVITVDDGHASFQRWALPLLHEFQVPATLFVVSDLPDGGAWLWTDKFEYICEAARLPLFPSREERYAAITMLKHTEPSVREQHLHELAERARIVVPALPPPPYTLLSWDELRGIARSPLIDIGSHTRTHATLCSIDDTQAREEVTGSRRELEHRLGVAVTAFCYPNGRWNDYRSAHVAMVVDAGYSCATATHFGYVRSKSDRLALPRIACHAADMARFRKRVDGLEYLQRRLRGERCW